MGFDDEFLTEIRKDFLQEAQDLLSQVESLSLQLEKNPGSTDIFSELARLAHNFKGSGKAVGFEDLANLAHHLESYMLALRDRRIDSSASNMDFLFTCLDRLKTYTGLLSKDFSAILDTTKLVVELESRTKGELSGEDGEESQPQVSTHSQVAPVPVVMSEGDSSFRVSKAKLDFLLESFGEQVILQSVLEQCRHDLQGNQDLILKTISQLNKLTIELQNHTLSLTMVSMRSTFTKLERAIRDAARLCGKEVEVAFVGEDTEIDKALIASLSDPLTHMVRNAVDHGLEDTSSRVAAGKSPMGKVSISARRVGGQMWIEVSDNGRGLNADILRSKAVEKRIMTRAQADTLSQDEAYRLIFANGFSTKDVASEISGRGVGMNVVQERIQNLRGSIEIKTSLGEGTCFQLKMPLSLAIFNGALVRINSNRFIVPSSEIEEVSRIPIESLETCIRGMHGVKAVRVRNEIFEVIDLRERFGGQSNGNDVTALLTRKGRARAFLVDEILGIQKIVQKPLSDEVKSRPEYVAATILGDGSPSIVLSLDAVVLNGIKTHAA